MAPKAKAKGTAEHGNQGPEGWQGPTIFLSRMGSVDGNYLEQDPTTDVQGDANAESARGRQYRETQGTGRRIVVQSQADDRGAGGASKERHKKLDSLDLLPSKGEREPLHVPKLLRSRSSPPKAPSGPSTFGSSKEDNETVAGWVEHDTKIRNAMPLNPTAEDLSCEKALPLHPAAEAALSRGKKRRGVKRYAGIGAQSSRVDQVVFGRDLDFTTTGDDSDLKAYEGSAGLPSHFHMKAGGVKKIETPKDSALIHTPLGVTAEAKQEENRRKEFRRPATAYVAQGWPKNFVMGLASHPALSPFHSPGMAEVFGHDEGGPMEDPARSPIHHGAAGARPFRSPKVRPQ
ncbi:unnamed protein product, partial [Cladocopium goreaui]